MQDEDHVIGGSHMDDLFRRQMESSTLLKAKSYFIETYGCQMNVADTEIVASVLEGAGYEAA